MITLEPLQPEELELAARWLSDDEINRWLTSEWRGQTVSGRFLAALLRGKRNRLLLVRVDGEPCGLVGYSDWDETDRTAMIWYLLGARPQGSKGIITQAVAEALRLGFEDHGLRCVYAWIIDGNQPSRRVLEKNGFRELGRMRSSTRRDDEQVDRIYFDLTREDHQAWSESARASN